jgi:hypothetical protein
MAKRDPRNPPTIRKRANVGYRKPPKSTQFKPGRSGNPKGRPKGVQNFETDLQETLRMPVEIRDANGIRKITKQKAALEKLADQALNGDARSIQQLFSLASRLRENRTEALAVLLDNADRAILDEYYYDRRAREAEQAESGSLPTAPATSNAATTDRGTLQ